MKPKHQRLIFLVVTVIFLITATILSMQAFKQNMVFFYSPSDISVSPPAMHQKIRVGGVVVAGSIAKKPPHAIVFEVTDGKHNLHITYSGVLPTLFREGQGVVAEGYLKGSGNFDAVSILAKHDETYMPKEVVDSLKKTGYWQKEYAR